MEQTTGRVVVKHDGEPRAIVADENEAFAWLLNHQGQSVHYATTYGGWAIERIRPWSDDEAKHHAAMARNVFYGDDYHRSGRCKHGTQMERMSCGTCALEGYEPRAGWEDGYEVRRDGPNYAGWARIYVEGRRAIPENWRDAFDRERNSDNLRYAEALERSILTWGITFR